VDGFWDAQQLPAGVPDAGAQDVQALAGPATQETAGRVMEAAGLADPARRYRPGGLHPDVSGLREQMGL
jgi:hypothetical protein